MSNLFRKNHLSFLVEKWEETKLPLDRLMSGYFRANKAIGSKDRKWISEKIYLLFRNLGLIDSFLKAPIKWEDRIELVFDSLPSPSSNIPEHIQVSFPKNLYELLKKRFHEKTKAICQTLAKRAPLCLRTNTLKISTDKLQKLLPISTKIGKKNPDALYCEAPLNVFTLPEFKKGYFEVQDEGSSFVISAINIEPKQIVVDYCAGSGGKTLAIAPKLQGTGQIYLHDIREKAALDAKKRLKRAGIQNAQYMKPGFDFTKLKQKVDHLLLDVPCSGSGTYRRNPDLKWKFTIENLKNLQKTQREIFAKSFDLVKKGGHIHYITCSLFLEENEEQVAFFEQNYPIKVEKQLLLEPEDGAHDGFFIATMVKE